MDCLEFDLGSLLPIDFDRNRRERAATENLSSDPTPKSILNDTRTLKPSSVSLDNKASIPPSAQDIAPSDYATQLSANIRGVRDKSSTLKMKGMKTLLSQSAATLLHSSPLDFALLQCIIALPFEILTPSSMSAGLETWNWLLRERPELETFILAEIEVAWVSSVKHDRGIFSTALNYADPFSQPIEYNPTDYTAAERAHTLASRLLTPHHMVLQMLFQAARGQRKGAIQTLVRLLLRSLIAHKRLSNHVLAREPRLSLLVFGFGVLKNCKLDIYCEGRLRDALYRGVLSWFSSPPQWSRGCDREQVESDIKVLSKLSAAVEADDIRSSHVVSSRAQKLEVEGASNHLRILKQLVLLLIQNEVGRLSVWINPLREFGATVNAPYIAAPSHAHSWAPLVLAAWNLNPEVAISLLHRFNTPQIQEVLTPLILRNPGVLLCSTQVLGVLMNANRSFLSKYILIWDAIPPVHAIGLFRENYSSNPFALQYAHRALAQHPIKVTFFFVPQIVQALRTDKLGYAKKLIFETSRISQLFCHQIIWNMRANCCKGDQLDTEDGLKPTLDELMARIVNSLDGDARAFYIREFNFFDQVTSISGKLKPFIKKTKSEKKAKIDEEMAKIVADPGVYLPSNPDGVVIDIDKQSGRPLQSHAKAPFMATFKIRKESTSFTEDSESVLGETTGGAATTTRCDTWQAAIFKVGDDCRQDVLALQIIAMFKNIFEVIGLPLYLYPYRVTATGPGCGIIDVVPDSTSRDEIGRLHINDLTAFFISKYGDPGAEAFEHARTNFIRSMAAYSLACYLLQIKDRHNGNIMIDGVGHIIHIDFGFLFDIGPGGVKFEPNSFKLTHEMVTLMGGRASRGYNLFQRLTVQGFLAVRPYADQIVETVKLMLGTGFPSFRGESTIKKLMDRFVPNFSERFAADYMAGVIKNAHENVRSTVYDEFQRIQNGIPYA